MGLLDSIRDGLAQLGPQQKGPTPRKHRTTIGEHLANIEERARRAQRTGPILTVHSTTFESARPQVSTTRGFFAEAEGEMRAAK